MCTLSVVTRDDGYLLGMNRDERVERGAGLPPAAHEVGGVRAIYPTDGAGGTWIAANEDGVTLALLNWNHSAIPRTDTDKIRSRGLVIPAVIGSRSLAQFLAAMDVLELHGMLSFRLVGIFPSEKEICEWRWCSGQVELLHHRWELRHWFSSSLSDEQAESRRGAACQDAWTDPDAGSAQWLRRLHGAHGDSPGPFSICVHRSDVRTLSYSEIEYSPGRLRVGHFLGSPCVRLRNDQRKEEGDCYSELHAPVQTPTAS
jgi:hypothetical protein